MRRATLLACLLSLASSPARASFSSWRAKAEKAERRGDAAEALESYSRALSFWKASDGKKAKASALAARSALHEKRGNPQAAIKDLSEALALEPKSPPWFHRRGRLHLSLKAPSLAISDFYKATALDINLAEAYYDRARAYGVQGDAKFAREDLKTACTLGFKKACGKGPPPDPKPKAQAAPGKEEVPASRPGAVEIKKPERKPASKADFEDCLKAVNACVDEGTSFGNCVRKTPVCEEEAKKGCCPEECAKRFRRMAAEVSEAAAFREIFKAGSPCAGP